MRGFCLVAVALSVFTLSAQDVPQQVFRQTVTQVLAPTTVTDKHGDFINGLRPQDFRVLDNGKPQDIQVDLAFHPISPAVCAQANNTMEGILPKIQKAASIFQPLVVGDQGEIALVTLLPHPRYAGFHFASRPSSRLP